MGPQIVAWVASAGQVTSESWGGVLFRCWASDAPHLLAYLQTCRAGAFSREKVTNTPGVLEGPGTLWREEEEHCITEQLLL